MFVWKKCVIASYFAILPVASYQSSVLAFIHIVRHPRTLARHVLQEVRHPRAVARHVLQEVRHPLALARHVLQEVRHPRTLVRHTIEWSKPMFLVLLGVKLVTERQNSHLREANTV